MSSPAVMDILANQIDEQKNADDAQRGIADALAAKTAEAQARLLEKVMGKKAPPIPPAVQEIVNALVSQPILIAPTQAFVRKLVANISAAIQKVVMESSPES